MGKSKGKRYIMSLCFTLAAASYWAMGILLTTGVPSYLSFPSVQIDSLSIWLLYRIILFSLAFFFYKKIPPLLKQPLFVVFAALSLLVGHYLPFLFETSILALTFVSFLLKALGYVFLFLLLIPYISSFKNWSTCLVAISVSMAVGFLEVLLIGYLPQNTLSANGETLALGVFAALAFASVLVLNYFMKTEKQAAFTELPDSSETSAEGFEEAFSNLADKPALPASSKPSDLATSGMPFSMLIGFVALAIPLSFFRSFSITSEMVVEDILVIGLALLLSLVVWAFNKFWSSSEVSQSTFTFSFIAFLSAGMLLLLIFGSSVLAGAFIFAGAYLLRAYIFTVSASYAKVNNVSYTIRYLALANLAIMLGHSIGLVSSYAAESFSQELFLYLFTGIISAVFLGGYYLAFRTQSTTRNQSAVSSFEYSLKNNTLETLIKDPEPLSAAIKELSQPAIKYYKLSKREAEIVALLVHGKSVSTIAKMLFLSESTIKSHMNRLYKKMRVHSREELIEALEHCAKRFSNSSA